MSAHFKRFLPFIAGGMLLAFGPAALAHCEPYCGPGGHKPPPHQPEQPKPQPPKPQPQPNVKVNVNVHNNVTAIAVAKSSANANASSSGGGEGDTFFSGGGAQVIATPGFPSSRS
jgi:hypothetical protein